MNLYSLKQTAKPRLLKLRIARNLNHGTGFLQQAVIQMI